MFGDKIFACAFLNCYALNCQWYPTDVIIRNRPFWTVNMQIFLPISVCSRILEQQNDFWRPLTCSQLGHFIRKNRTLKMAIQRQRLLLLLLCLLMGFFFYQFDHLSGSIYPTNKECFLESDIYECSKDHRCRLINYDRLPNDNFTLVRLRVKDEPYICVYNSSKEDGGPSHYIQTFGIWENDNVKMIVDRLNDDPELAFFDIGSNIGQFSLVAASMGRKVIAVEALKKHALMLGRAVVVNGYQDQVKIVHNALSNTYRNVTLVSFPTNPGGTRVKTDLHYPHAFPVSGQVPTILMDDLVNIVDFKRAIMKIDIEGQEVPALSHSLQFFTKVDIPFIIMEWWGGAMKLYRTEEGTAMVTLLISFFKSYGYNVYSRDLKMLDINKWREWPFEIIWKRSKWTQPIKTSLNILYIEQHIVKGKLLVWQKLHAFFLCFVWGNLAWVLCIKKDKYLLKHLYMAWLFIYILWWFREGLGNWLVGVCLLAALLIQMKNNTYKCAGVVS